MPSQEHSIPILPEDCDTSISFKVTFHSKSQNLLKNFCCPFCLLIEVGLRFLGLIRLWTDR